MKKFFALCLAGMLVGSVAGHAEDKVDFASQIHPILQQSCVQCHGPDRQRGRLRLDEKEVALAKAIVPGKAEESEFFIRISLPPDDPDIMPPEGEGEPLTKEQIELIRLWINQGADWPEGLPSVQPPAETPGPPAQIVATGPVDFSRDIRPILEQLQPEQVEVLARWLRQQAELLETQILGRTDEAPGPAPVQLVEAPESEAEREALAKLQTAGVLASRVARNVNWLRANFRLLGKEITNEHLAPLADMPNLIEVDLSNTAITDEGLAVIENLPNVTWLNLSNTGITDAALSRIAGLQNLEYLNVYGTSVTDAGLEYLESIRTLKKLFVWQTNVTADGAAALEKALPGLEIVRGVELAVPSPESES